MRLDWLRPVADGTGPFLTVSLDATRDGPDGAKEVELRWQAHEERLRAQGASEQALAAVREVVTEPTHRGGPVGRLVVATDDGVQLDLVLPEAPGREESQWGPVPHLLPVARATSGISHVVVDVDRTGADLELTDALGAAAGSETVQGSDDEVHAAHVRGTSQRRVESRVEDTTARNAAQVAAELDRVVRRQRPELVLVRGDDQVVAELLDAVGPDTASKVVRVPGSRAAGGSEQRRREDVARALAERAAAHRADVLDRFEQGEQRQDLAVEGLDAVVESLRRGQVEEVLLHDDPSSTLRLWVGSTPGAVATRRSDLVEAGEESPQEVAAGAALVWGAISTGAGLTLVGGRPHGTPEQDLADDSAGHRDRQQVTLTDGVGALLRYSDASTSHDGLRSMPGRGEPSAGPV
ncbi:baeRF2 domain-containing protein [Angustibacter aerolatus]